MQGQPKTDPCIICVAIAGSLPAKANKPAVPITVSEQVQSTRGDRGAPISDPDRFVRLMQGLRPHCPGMIIQLSTGGWRGALP